MHLGPNHLGNNKMKNKESPNIKTTMSYIHDEAMVDQAQAHANKRTLVEPDLHAYFVMFSTRIWKKVLHLERVQRVLSQL